MRNPGFTVRGSEVLKYIGLPYLFLLVSLFFPMVLWSQDNADNSGPALTAVLDRTSAKVGDIVVAHLAYRLPDGARLLDEPEIKGLEGLTILKTTIGPDEISIKLLVDRLDPWRSQPLSIAYLDKEDKTKTLSADPISLSVSSNLGDKPEEVRLRSIQDIIPTKAGWLKFMPWTAALLFILSALGCLFWYRNRRRSLKSLLELDDPPHIRAQKEIEQLEARGLFEKGYVKEFYFLFSEILRRYLGSIRNFPALEFTTEEIASHLDNEQDRKLLHLLRQADLIKFADTIPTSARKGDDLNAAKNFMHETSPAHDNDHGGNLQQGVSL